MKTIDNDIKAGDFKKVYLLYGQERYLIKQYRDKLIKAMVSEGDSMNFSSFEGDGINQKEIIDLAETLPFFADKRVILIEDAGIFSKAGDELGEYLKDSPEVVKEKIMKAVTDPEKIKKDDKANPDVCMVYYYHKLINNPNLETVCKECKNGTRGCVACKKELIENIEEFLAPIRKKRKYYEENPEIVKEILDNGTKEAKIRADATMKKVKASMMIDY